MNENLKPKIKFIFNILICRLYNKGVRTTHVVLCTSVFFASRYMDSECVKYIILHDAELFIHCAQHKKVHLTQ